MKRLILVEHGNIHLAWKDAKPYLERAIKTQDEYSLENVYTELTTGSLTLWMFYNDEVGKPFGAMTTCMYSFPQKNTLLIHMMAADNFDDMAPLFADLVAYAKKIGAKSIECLGRFGLEKLLNDLGFKKISITMGYDVK